MVVNFLDRESRKRSGANAIATVKYAMPMKRQECNAKMPIDCTGNDEVDFATRR